MHDGAPTEAVSCLVRNRRGRSLPGDNDCDQINDADHRVGAWRVRRPAWYLVSEHDNAITPDEERFMAERMGANTKSIAGSHTAFIAQPVTVAGFIADALQTA
jgi:pimeloyl-ACP methyl ester carboxylesterase